MGLIAAIFSLTILASLAGDEFAWKEVLVLSAILSVGCYLTFVLLLRLPFVIWPALISG
jgi:hypothetical protein